MTDYSLAGYEMINVKEYFPILTKIKNDLSLIFETDVNNLELLHSLAPSPDFRSTYTETGDHIDNEHQFLSLDEVDKVPISDKRTQKQDSLRLTTKNENIINFKDEEILILKTKIKDLEESQDSLNNDIQNKDLKIQKMNLKIENQESLAKDLENKREIIEELEHTIKELCPLKDHLQKKDNHISDLESKIRELKSGDNNLDENYQVILGHLQHKKAQLHEKVTEISSLETTLEDSEIKYRKLEKECRFAKRECNKLKEELTDSTKDLEEKDKIIRLLKKQLKDMNMKEADTTNYLKDIEDLKKGNSIHMKEKEQLSAECDRSKILIEATEKKVKDRDQQIVDKDKSINYFKAELENAKNNLTKLEETLKVKQEAINKMKAKIKESLNKNPNQSNEFKILEREMYNKVEENKQMKIKIENYNETLEKTYQEVELLKKEITKLNEELRNLKLLNFNQKKDQASSSDVINTTASGRSPNQQSIPKTLNYPNWWKNHMTS